MSSRAAGHVVALYVRPEPRAPVEARDALEAIAGQGIEGDHRRGGRRQVTLLAREGWDAACAEVDTHLDPGARRANVVIEGFALEEALGRLLRVGTVLVEVIGELTPCERMDEAHPGLRAALGPDLRGGAFGRIALGGTIRVGSTVALVEPA